MNRRAQGQDFCGAECPLALSANLFPQRNLRRLGHQLAHPRQHRPQLRLLQMSVQVRLALPILVEEEPARMLHLLVEIIVDAPGVLAARPDQREQFPAHLRLLPGLSFELRNHRKRFAIHSAPSIAHPKPFQRCPSAQ